MAKIELPRLAGTREAVSDLLEDQGVAARLDGDDLVVFAHALASGSPSFADELVREAIEIRGADHLVLVAPPELFAERVRDAATRRGVDARLLDADAATARG